MSKYRCPICGAAHKEQVANCRLCGQSMSPNAIPAFQQDVKEEVHTDKSIKGVVLIGAALVLAILVGAVIFGVLRPSRQLEKVGDVVTGTRRDGWTELTSEAGRFRVEMPADAVQETVELPITDSGEVTGATAAIPSKSNTETSLLVGSGTVTLADTTTGSAASVAAARNYLDDVVMPKWMAAHGLDVLEFEVAETAIGGFPAMRYTSLGAKAQLQGRDAYAQVALVLRGSTVYVIQTLSIFKDAEQQSQMISTFAVTS